MGKSWGECKGKRGNGVQWEKEHGRRVTRELRTRTTYRERLPPPCFSASLPLPSLLLIPLSACQLPCLIVLPTLSLSCLSYLPPSLSSSLPTFLPAPCPPALLCTALLCQTWQRQLHSANRTFLASFATLRDFFPEPSKVLQRTCQDHKESCR